MVSIVGILMMALGRYFAILWVLGPLTEGMVLQIFVRMSVVSKQITPDAPDHLETRHQNQDYAAAPTELAFCPARVLLFHCFVNSIFPNPVPELAKRPKLRLMTGNCKNCPTKRTSPTLTAACRDYSHGACCGMGIVCGLIPLY